MTVSVVALSFRCTKLFSFHVVYFKHIFLHLLKLDLKATYEI